MRYTALRVSPTYSSAVMILKSTLKTIVFSNIIKIFVFSCNSTKEINAIHQLEVADG